MTGTFYCIGCHDFVCDEDENVTAEGNCSKCGIELVISQEARY